MQVKQETQTIRIEGVEFTIRFWYNDKKIINVSYPEKNKFLQEVWDKLVQPRINAIELHLTGQKTLKECLK